MKLTAKITTKQRPPIFNAHRDPRPYVLFLCELFHGKEMVADSGAWASTERKAIENAQAHLARIEVDIVRDGYEPTDFEWRVDGWGQLHVRTTEDAARVKEILS